MCSMKDAKERLDKLEDALKKALEKKVVPLDESIALLSNLGAHGGDRDILKEFLEEDQIDKAEYLDTEIVSNVLRLTCEKLTKW